MKYRLTDEKKYCNGHIIHRIICVKAFGEVKEGELGGWIEKVGNLSQYGNSWVYGNATVYGDAFVYGDARVSDNASVSACAVVCADACVKGDAVVCGNAFVGGNACVKGNTLVSDYARIAGYAFVIDHARIGGKAEVFGNAKIGGYAQVNKNTDFIVFKNHFSSGRYFTWTRSDNMWSVGCFRGTGDELIAKAYQDDDEKGRFYEAYVDFVQRLEIIEEEMEKSLQN